MTPQNLPRPQTIISLGENAIYPKSIFNYSKKGDYFFLEHHTWQGEKIKDQIIYDETMLKQFLDEYTTPFYKDEILNYIYKDIRFKQFTVRLGSY